MSDILEYLEKHNEKQAALIFLDAEKAFDNLNWTFMFKALEDTDSEEKFFKLVKSIYTPEPAKITVDGDFAKPYEIQKGIKQVASLGYFR